MHVVPVDDGFDFHVVVLDDTWVVRVPRRPASAEALAVEGALLPALAPHWDVDDELRRRAPVYHRLAPWFGAHRAVFLGHPPNLDGVRARLC